MVKETSLSIRQPFEECHGVQRAGNPLFCQQMRYIRAFTFSAG